VVVPLDVGRFKPERLVPQPQVVPADGTLAGVCLEDAGAEVRVARPLRRRGESRTQPDSLQKTPVEGWLKVFAQEQPGDTVAPGGVFFEGSPDRAGKSTMDVVFEQFALQGIGVGSAAGQWLVVRDGPDPIVLETPEWVFRMMPFPGRPELDQEPFQVRVHVSERNPTDFLP
jgi:hypothetical protein